MSGLAALCWASLAGAAWAQEAEGALSQATVSGSEDTELRYWNEDRVLPGFEEYDNLYDYVEWVNRLNLLADAGRWRAGVQLDSVAMFGAKYYLDDVLTYEFDLHADGVSFPLPMSYVRLEKGFVTLVGDRVQLQVGDSYQSFGRGLALNLVRNTDIDLDSSVRGVQLSSSVGAWSVSAISGLTNHQQVWQDNPNRQQIQPDKKHMVSGARVERYGRVNVGAHGVAYTFARGIDGVHSPLVRYTEPVDALVGGATVEAFGVKGVDLFVEGDWYHHRSDALFGGEEVEPGWAVYATASAYPGPFAVLLEAKSTRNTERVNAFANQNLYDVAVGPTLEYERVITEDSAATLNSDDLTGARLRVDWSARPGELVTSLTMAAFRDRDLGGLHFNPTPETILHPVASVDWTAGDAHLLLNAGLRTDLRDDGPDGEDYGADRLAHADVSLGVPAGPVHLELGGDVRYFWWGVNQNQQTDFIVSTLSLAAHLPRELSVVLYNDITNDPLIDSVGNLSELVYGAGELQWQPFDGATVKLFYGAYRAGIRCAGGQCRMLPGFNGARLSATVNF